jgi:hypothetical protein
MRKRKLMLDREILSSNGREEVKGASDLGCPYPTQNTCYVSCPNSFTCNLCPTIWDPGCPDPTE